MSKKVVEIFKVRKSKVNPVPPVHPPSPIRRERPRPRPLPPKDVTNLCVEAQNILSAIADIKKLYARLDTITLQLLDQDLSKHKLCIVDNFSEKNVSWKMCGISRWEIKRTV